MKKYLLNTNSHESFLVEPAGLSNLHELIRVNSAFYLC